MEHYVTLFDSTFLPQGLALHLSMTRHLKPFCLWIICVDDVVFKVLKGIDLEHVRLLKLSKLENNDLLSVKKERTKGEYCWTLTPFAPRFVFDADESISRVTYLDADLWFKRSPIEIFREFEQSGKEVLITEHAYAPEYDQSATSGRYCVQYVTFTRCGGESVRKYWEDKCIEWCYARFENGKFGDQKYLEEWPAIFGDKVHVLKNKELIMGPWNAIRFPYCGIVAWHFHGVRLINKKYISIGNYKIPAPTFEGVYKKYFFDLRCSISNLASVGFEVKWQRKKNILDNIMWLLILARAFCNSAISVKNRRRW